MLVRNLSICLAAAVLGSFALTQAACGEDPVNIGTGPDSADIVLRVQGVVGDQALVVDDERYEASTVAEGFRFSRVSVFLSDLRLLSTVDGRELETPVDDVVYLDFQTTDALTFNLDAVPSGTYTGIRFNFGLTEEQDDQTPADFAANHPLANADEYWQDWGAYVFLKLEGRADTLADSEERMDAPFVYHVGRASQFTRELSVPMNFTAEGTTTEVALEFDVAALMGIGSVNEVPLAQVADHQNNAAERLVTNAQQAFSASN